MGFGHTGKYGARPRIFFGPMLHNTGCSSVEGIIHGGGAVRIERILNLEQIFRFLETYIHNFP